MDINEDKKLFLALWAFLNKPEIARVLYAILSSFIFAGATNSEFGIINNFYDGGIAAIVILAVIPYPMSKWGLPINFSSGNVKKAMVRQTFIFGFAGAIFGLRKKIHKFKVAS